MSPAHVLEPTYRTIRRRLTRGDWPMGFRLDTARLAAEMGVNTSPVRDSLNRLAGELMVDFTPGNGFHVPWIDDEQLRELLDLNLLLVLAATDSRAFALPAPTVQDDGAEGVAETYRRIAWCARNGELLRIIDATGSRLAPALRFDADVLGECAADTDELDDALAGTSLARVRELVCRHHALRRENAGSYIFLMRMLSKR